MLPDGVSKISWVLRSVLNLVNGFTFIKAGTTDCGERARMPPGDAGGILYVGVGQAAISGLEPPVLTATFRGCAFSATGMCRVSTPWSKWA